MEKRVSAAGAARFQQAQDQISLEARGQEKERVAQQRQEQRELFLNRRADNHAKTVQAPSKGSAPPAAAEQEARPLAAGRKPTRRPSLLRSIVSRGRKKAAAEPTSVV